jgi:hypothetical protein
MPSFIQIRSIDTTQKLAELIATQLESKAAYEDTECETGEIQSNDAGEYGVASVEDTEGDERAMSEIVITLNGITYQLTVQLGETDYRSPEDGGPGYAVTAAREAADQPSRYDNTNDADAYSAEQDKEENAYIRHLSDTVQQADKPLI